MKWRRKYNIDLKEVHEKNINGDSLVVLSAEYGVPKTTLGRYLINAGYKIKMNGRNPFRSYFISKTDKDIDYDYGPKNTIPWKQALVFHFGHKCRICGYDKIVEAHHVIPTSEGGSTSLKNGILLCPNCHAEVHAELLDLTEALVKLDKLLEHSFIENNQQPSHVSKHITPSDMEGSETTPRAKAVIGARTSRSRSKRFGKEEYAMKFPLLRDKI
jgi:hypothetical protein